MEYNVATCIFIGIFIGSFLEAYTAIFMILLFIIIKNEELVNGLTPQQILFNLFYITYFKLNSILHTDIKNLNNNNNNNLLLDNNSNNNNTNNNNNNNSNLFLQNNNNKLKLPSLSLTALKTNKK